LYPGINHKRVYRVYSQEGLAIRKRKKTKRVGMRLPLMAAGAINQTWSMDFVSDAIARPGAIARRIKCLTVADDFSHECVDITADFGIGGEYVTRLLERAAQFRGYTLRTDPLTCQHSPPCHSDIPKSKLDTAVIANPPFYASDYAFAVIL
jgi:putative transposase